MKRAGRVRFRASLTGYGQPQPAHRRTWRADGRRAVVGHRDRRAL